MNRKAFTLFELMIVVILVGTVYALVLTNFNTKKKVRIAKIENIKRSLFPFWSKGKQVDLYLFDNCKKSALFINDTYQEEFSLDIKKKEFENIEVYKTDYRGESKKVEYPPIMIEKKLHKVCFKYTIFNNGSSSSYIIKKDKRYYIYYPYFQDVNISDNLSEAMDLYTHKMYRGVITPDEFND